MALSIYVTRIFVYIFGDMYVFTTIIIVFY
jgi:hypothetical protein